MRHILTGISTKFKLRKRYVLKRFVKRAPVARFTKLSYDISYLMIETTLRSDL